MSAAALYFVTDEQGAHIMTAPASTVETIFGLTAEQVMRMLSETSEPGREHRIARAGRRVTDKTIRVRRLAADPPVPK